MRFLRTSTSTFVTVGPFISASDGYSACTGFAGSVCHLTFVNDSNTSACLIVDADATTTGGSNNLNHITNDDAGFYGLTFTACQLGYVGRGFLSINASAYLPVFHEFTLLPANTYDSLIGGTDFLNAGLSASGVDAILDEVVEGTYTMRQYLRLMAAALYGKASGGGTTTITFRDTGDSANRIVATVDSSGNRSAVILTGS